MNTLFSYPKDIIARFKKESLFQNSIYLMLTTGVMSGLGFVFWIIATRLYSSEQIGFATALISATVLLSNFSLMGFNSALVRYLPKSEKPNILINTAILIVIGATAIISAIYLLGINHFAPSFNSLVSNPAYSVLFIIFMILLSVNLLTDSIFVAYRSSKYNLIVYTTYSIIKIILPLLLVSLGAYGIFIAYTSAVLVSITLSFYFLFKKFDYRPHWSINKEIAKRMASFSLTNYLATFMSGVPTLILPTLIVSRLGATQSAYFYMASTISNLLYAIPQATTQSLFAEGSNDEERIIAFVKSSLKIISLLLVPGILAIIVLGKYVLLIFGKEYSANSDQLLQIMAITGIFLAINLIGSTIMKIHHQMKELLAVNFGYIIVTTLLILFWIKYGIIGLGFALLGGQVFICLEYAIFFFILKRKSVRS